jgi:hypothetical protein
MRRLEQQRPERCFGCLGTRDWDGETCKGKTRCRGPKPNRTPDSHSPPPQLGQDLHHEANIATRGRCSHPSGADENNASEAQPGLRSLRSGGKPGASNRSMCSGMARVSTTTTSRASCAKPLRHPGQARKIMAALLERIGRGDIRSTFRDSAAEMTSFPREVAEMALAHGVDDKVEAVYGRGDLFEKRRRLMEAWAGYCAKPATPARWCRSAPAQPAYRPDRQEAVPCWMRFYRELWQCLAYSRCPRTQQPADSRHREQ